MRSLFALVPLVFTVTISSAQTAPPFEPQPSNEFGTRIWREAANHQDANRGNRLVSPIANYLAWSMVLNGTAQETRTQLIKTLGATVDELALGRINGSNRDCQDVLVTPENPANEMAPVLTIANGAWVSNQDHGGRPFDFSPEFTKNLEYFYGVDPAKVNFKTGESARQINGWFDEKTNHLIPHVVDHDEIKELMFLLGNATYFRGSWASSFHVIRPSGDTTDLTNFTLADGTVSPRTMISATDHFLHVDDEAEEIIELPFVSESPADKEFVFYAVLPKGSHGLEEYRHAQAWTRVVDKLSKAETENGVVVLPKFQFDFSYAATANSPLAQALDLDHLFQNGADLSAIKTPESADAKVGLFKSVNRIELDERGVKAAAAVVIGGIMVTSVGPSPSYRMKLDRPFAFAIAEKVTGALVFVGEVADPN